MLSLSATAPFQVPFGHIRLKGHFSKCEVHLGYCPSPMYSSGTRDTGSLLIVDTVAGRLLRICLTGVKTPTITSPLASSPLTCESEGSLSITAHPLTVYTNDSSEHSLQVCSLCSQHLLVVATDHFFFNF